MSEPVTSQPTSKSINVEVPEIDVNELIQGDWKVGHFECLKDPPMCKLESLDCLLVFILFLIIYLLCTRS